jgi:hypothetical protein
MKKQKNEYTNLRKVENRWKWMAGATAATAAGAVSAQGGMITVNLTDNFISSLENHLNADLTGDGQPDLTITNAVNGYSSIPDHGSFRFAGVDLNGVHAFDRFGFYDRVVTLSLGSKKTFFYIGSIYRGYAPSQLVGSIPISFKDLHINGGRLTAGSLEVTVSALQTQIQLDSFTYNTRENVPDQGSSLALLAIGASGVLAFRRLRTAKKHS